MGVGHVPSGPLPGARRGADFPRRERRGIGTVRAQALNASERGLGRFGEDIAVWFLNSHGLRVIDRNRRVGRGEVDLIAVDQVVPVVIEVRTRRGRSDPIDAISNEKRRHVRWLAGRLRIARVDLIGISIAETGIDVHWVSI